MKLAAALAVVAGLAIASPASAQTVSCGQVITRDTRVQNDLINCPGDGLVIGADNITLDLNGHTIDGNGVGILDSGIDNSAGHDGVTIRGGAIRQFGGGVVLEGAIRNRVRRLALSDNDAEIHLSSSHGNLITGNSLSSVDDLMGIRLFRSDNNRVEANSLLGVFSNGIRIDDGASGNRVARNSLVGEAPLGAAIVIVPLSALGGSNQNRVERNSVLDYGFGIEVIGSHQCLVRRNRLARVDIGITVDRATNTRVRQNSLRLNAGAEVGISLGGARATVVSKNFVSGPPGDVARTRGGIEVWTDFSARNVVEENFVTGNENGISVGSLATRPDGTRVRKNTVSRNRSDGIVVSTRATHTLLDRNVANQNGDDGIGMVLDAVEPPTITLRGNVADSNADLGIEAVPGVIDGGANSASGNGNPLQCLNVFCR